MAWKPTDAVFCGSIGTGFFSKFKQGLTKRMFTASLFQVVGKSSEPVKPHIQAELALEQRAGGTQDLVARWNTMQAVV